MQPKLSDEYFELFDRLLVEIAKQHGRHPKRQRGLSAVGAQVGRDYKSGGFMLVGRAVNGAGKPPWTPAELDDKKQRKDVLADLRRNTFKTSWLPRYRRSAFWQVGERVFNLLGYPENGFWADNIVWSNFDKVMSAVEIVVHKARASGSGIFGLVAAEPLILRRWRRRIYRPPSPVPAATAVRAGAAQVVNS